VSYRTQVKPKSGLLTIKLKHTGHIWRKVIKHKFPGEAGQEIRE
jgi:hypothetical protein